MHLSPLELDEIVREIRQLAGETGALLLAGRTSKLHIRKKGTVDLVTECDERAEALICDRLRAKYPDMAILGEETGVSGPGAATMRFIVDPLDGTTNFAHRHPLFAVSIGLEIDGEMALGVIHLPVLGQTIWARKGGGAFCDETAISVSGATKLGSSLLSTGFPYDRHTNDDDNMCEYAAFIKCAQGIRRCGSAAIDLAWVAMGIYDGFWEPRLKPWDVAAGILIVEEAGGIVTDYEGAPPDIERGWVVAATPVIHAPMLAVIQKSRRTLPSGGGGPSER